MIILESSYQSQENSTNLRHIAPLTLYMMADIIEVDTSAFFQNRKFVNFEC